jgi:hypothetical protein
VGVFRARVYRPSHSLGIYEPAPLGNQLGAMAGMAHTGVDEPEAPVGLDVEGLGVVAHTGTLSTAGFAPKPDGRTGL